MNITVLLVWLCGFMFGIGVWFSFDLLLLIVLWWLFGGWFGLGFAVAILCCVAVWFGVLFGLGLG